MNTITEKDYQKLKQSVEEAKSQASRAQGALDQQLQHLKDEFGCETLKEAKKLLVDLEKKRDAAQEDFEQKMEQYEEKWSPSTVV